MSRPLVNGHGQEEKCQRTACTADGPADHAGGAHLDPRDRERFDGNGTSLRAASIYVRDDLWALELVKGEHPELAEVIDVAIHSALERISFLSQQVAHVQVDADRKVREAGGRALSCEAHGETIAGLTHQAVLIEESREREERGRLALLGFLTAVDDLTCAYRERRVSFAGPGQLIEALEAASKKAHSAHRRGWQDRGRKAGGK